MLGLIQPGLLAWLMFVGLGSLASAALYPWLRSRVNKTAPESRAKVLRALCAFPLLGGLAFTLLCFLPATVGLVFPSFDHCPQHGSGHLHLCVTHVPQTAGSITAWLVLFGFGALLVVKISNHLLTLRQSRRLLRQLTNTASFSSEHQAWLLDCEAPVAMTTGIRRKRTLLSSGLVQRLCAQSVRAVVAHEHAHEARHDTFWKMALGVVSFAHLPATRRALLADHEFASEQACDDRAGVDVGSRVRVAQALIAVERMRVPAAPAGLVALSFGAHGLPARIESLVTTPTYSKWSSRTIQSVAFATVVALLLAADLLHHFTETVVALFLG